jgi:hypothetical protein
MNHYTTFFTYQSQKESVFLMDTGVDNILDDKYATASSGWLQVNRPETAKFIHHIDIYMYIYAFMRVCVCVCI